MFGLTKKIRYAVVGGGQISQQAFMPGIGQTKHSELAALVTGDPVKADKLAKQYGIPAYHYDDLPKLIAGDEIDAFYIATPNFKHRQYAVPVLEGGKHVLLEKAMEASVEDCEAIIAAQKKGGGKLMIAYRLHCEPGTVELITRAQKGDFGRLMMFNSTFGQNFSEENHRGHSGYWAGPVPDSGTYPLNAVRNLFGEEPLEVRAIGVKTPGRSFNFHDTVSVTLTFPDNRLAHFLVSYACSMVEEFTLVGDKGTVHAAPCFMFGPGEGISYTATIGEKKEERPHKAVEQFGGETDYFSECILNDRDPEPNGEEGLMDVRVLAAIERALETGEVQKLAPAKRSRHVEPDQVRDLKLTKEPTPDQMISIVPQSA
ncbi:Gfo/Idh/MocA family protein [Kozakia baliensis]|uniref:Gfo/Idh/MocA family protein n=1 Tax=Kozakia baliensis TaxID=153496 RepID=UPI00087BDA95|nr:Gfo/Idh/MocA family oxidoreductase [Kozakia baliensis]AOX19338.1 glucose-fructose oxidoreductase [Kozakia baliensis]